MLVTVVLPFQDEDHLDLVRVLITGPTGTPYGRGCYVFDIFYPVSYPTNPPLVVMTTTGGGTVRYILSQECLVSENHGSIVPVNTLQI